MSDKDRYTYFKVTWLDRDGGRIVVETGARVFNFSGSAQDAVYFRRMLAAAIATAFRRSADAVSDWQNSYD